MIDQGLAPLSVIYRTFGAFSPDTNNIKQEFGVTEVVELRSSRVTDAADASLFWPLND
jgi:hypothetical protein